MGRETRIAAVAAQVRRPPGSCWFTNSSPGCNETPTYDSHDREMRYVAAVLGLLALLILVLPH
jgi:hypothetical protein